MHACHDAQCLIQTGQQGGDFVGEPDTAERTNGELTGLERMIMETNAIAWNGFLQLPYIYPHDREDIRMHVDAIHAIILARAAARANPEVVRKEMLP